MQRLLLFDIDGTLIRCGPQVRPLFAEALVRVFGATGDLDGYSFAGKTDPRIVLDLMANSGLDPEEVEARIPALQAAYLENLDRGLERRRMTLLPGVLPLVERLAEQDDVLLGLLTGNWRDGARIKLSRFDLFRHFPLGAFGDDAVCRRELAAIALDRASEARGHRFEPEEVLVIGDTPLDVDCAHAVGVPCLAVTTGSCEAEALHAAGADYVFDSLEEAADQLAHWF